MNQYGDTGMSVSDGIITKNGDVVGSYNEISGAIDEVIEKQHAQNLMEIAESGYKEALENRQELLDNETEYAKKVSETEEKIRNTSGIREFPIALNIEEITLYMNKNGRPRK